MVEEGQLAWEKLHAENMTEFEFFMELRVNSVEQLGEVRLAILETNGQISVFYYPDEEVRAGLSILPAHCTTRYTTIPQEGMLRLRALQHRNGDAGGRKTNMSRAAQMQNGRRPAGRNGLPDSKYVGLITSSR